MSLVAVCLGKSPPRSETLRNNLPTIKSVSPAVQWRGKDRGRVLRNASLTRRNNSCSFLLNIYCVPDIMLGFTFYITSYLLFIAEKIKTQRG